MSFTYLFGLENTWSHRLMVAAVAGLIALVLFTIGNLEYPFSGGTRIGPEAFELVRGRFEISELGNPPITYRVQAKRLPPYSPECVEQKFSEVRKSSLNEGLK